MICPLCGLEYAPLVGHTQDRCRLKLAEDTIAKMVREREAMALALETASALSHAARDAETHSYSAGACINLGRARRAFDLAKKRLDGLTVSPATGAKEPT